MPFTQKLTNRHFLKERLGKTEGIVTKTADMIVKELQNGPASARELSQRMDGLSYANLRQTLCRLSKAGTVTKIKRGVYQLAGFGCRAGSKLVDAASLEESLPQTCNLEPQWAAPNFPVAGVRPSAADDFWYALELVRQDFEAMNDLYDHRAWV